MKCPSCRKGITASVDDVRALFTALPTHVKDELARAHLRTREPTGQLLVDEHGHTTFFRTPQDFDPFERHDPIERATPDVDET